MKFNWILVVCPSIFTMCKKDMDKFHEPQMVAICSPYICAKSLDWSLHICLDRKYRRQCYQMMLRYKRWTFKAWYQSECTIIPSLASWLAWHHLKTLGNEIIRYPMHASFSFHHSNLQLAYTTQAWMLKFKTCAMQANIWNAHSNAPYKFMSLLSLLVCSKF